MDGNSNITTKVRNEIPNILRNISNVHEGLQFNELFNQLKGKFGEELVDENNKDRTGVLRGVVNKIDHIPIKNVRMEKRGTKTFYVYVMDELTELSRVSKQFINELNERGLTSTNVLNMKNQERNFYNKFIDTIANLNMVIKEFEEQNK
ncbi:hypothetical protein COI51_21765 [Bacillus toyonensis]|uniref:hypothetical protein n=1 Tax=Bacillus cereus group TaxID=86661 RepID=UPI000BF1AD54|nr:MULTISPECIES: hypothetical protein [Bacillus cereus group]PEM13354.1 hypothetical protein CN616_25185 [Bacillus toyonensis]PGA39902.1 hypothetical protein COL85_26860 [Bacillus toyonensis]PGB24961.1 hypothetical protein COM06_19445 [Bacillus toyonensis]PGC36723.1 hypothetical protein COM10_12630 [Bacillus toyonensis]PGK77493.1 hypothetical protein CN919_15715 [Bacillus thuringiensis]